MFRALRRMFGRWKPARQRPPGTARFLTRHYAGPFGRRDYKLYLPASRKRDAAPLVVMLHGCRQGPDDFAAGTRMNALAEAHGFLVAYPAQSRVANGLRCWNWFESAHQKRGTGEPSVIAGIVEEVAKEFGVDRRRVFVAGLSAGGAMAAVMGETYPELFAAVGVHSGVPYGLASDLRSALDAMAGKVAHPPAASSRVPTIVFHGDADTTVRHGGAGWMPPQHAVDTTTGEANGRSYSRTLLRDGSKRVVQEHWLVHGAGHAWSGGSTAGSYADPRGPDASREMIRFFMER